MKKIILLLAVMFVFLVTNAQLNVKAGLTANLPFRKMGQYYAGGPGVDVNVKYIIANKWGIGISSGFQHFFAKDWGDIYDDINFNIVPVRAWASYYLGTGSVKSYLGCELGLNMTELTYTFDFYDAYQGYTYEISSEYSSTRFGIAPLIGIQIDLGSLLALDINTKINLINKVGDDAPKQTATYLGANIGLVFKFVGKNK
jgi:hypothetical protein